jgi:transcriptional regulator with XRE-family HTH domain
MGDFGKETQSAITVQIKAEIGARGWRQSDLCNATGLPTSTISRYLSGARDIPLPVFAEIAYALGLSIRGLLARAQRRQDG